MPNNAPTPLRPLPQMSSEQLVKRKEIKDKVAEKQGPSFKEKAQQWWAQQVAKRLRTDRDTGNAHEGLVKLRTGEVLQKGRTSREWSRTVVRIDSVRVLTGQDRRFVRNNRAEVAAELKSVVDAKRGETKRTLTDKERKDARKEAIDICRLRQKRNQHNEQQLQADIRSQAFTSSELNQAVTQRIEQIMEDTGNMPSRAQEEQIRRDMMQGLVQEAADVYNDPKFADEVAKQVSLMRAEKRAEEQRLAHLQQNSIRSKANARETVNLHLVSSDTSEGVHTDALPNLSGENGQQNTEPLPVVAERVRLDQVSFAELQVARQRAFNEIRRQHREQAQSEPGQEKRVVISDEQAMNSRHFTDKFNQRMVQARNDEDLAEARAEAIRYARQQMQLEAKAAKEPAQETATNTNQDRQQERANHTPLSDDDRVRMKVLQDQETPLSTDEQNELANLQQRNQIDKKIAQENKPAAAEKPLTEMSRDELMAKYNQIGEQIKALGDDPDKDKLNPLLAMAAAILGVLGGAVVGTTGKAIEA